jgi:hypothetical protein
VLCVTIRARFNAGTETPHVTVHGHLAIVKNESDGTSDVVVVNQRTGLPTKQSAEYQKTKLSPKMEQAVRLWAMGRGTQETVAKATGVSKARLGQVIASDAGQAIYRETRGELEHKFQALFEKTINVLELALDHPDPSIALAGANLWLKSAKATKVEVQLTAEDIVQKLMSGQVIE